MCRGSGSSPTAGGGMRSWSYLLASSAMTGSPRALHDICPYRADKSSVDGCCRASPSVASDGLRSTIANGRRDSQADCGLAARTAQAQVDGERSSAAVGVVHRNHDDPGQAAVVTSRRNRTRHSRYGGVHTSASSAVLKVSTVIAPGAPHLGARSPVRPRAETSHAAGFGQQVSVAGGGSGQHRSARFGGSGQHGSDRVGGWGQHRSARPARRRGSAPCGSLTWSGAFGCRPPSRPHR